MLVLLFFLLELIPSFYPIITNSPLPLVPVRLNHGQSNVPPFPHPLRFDTLSFFVSFTLARSHALFRFVLDAEVPPVLLAVVPEDLVEEEGESHQAPNQGRFAVLLVLDDFLYVCVKRGVRLDKGESPSGKTRP